MRVCRGFGTAKRLTCEGGSKSIDCKGSSSLAWLLEEEEEEELGEADEGVWGWVRLGGIVGWDGERVVERGWGCCVREI